MAEISTSVLPTHDELLRQEEKRRFEDAVERGDRAAVQRAIDLGVDICVVGPLRRPVLLAVRGVETARLLLEYRVDLNACEARGSQQSAAHAVVQRLAACSNQEDIALLEFFVTPTPSGRTLVTDETAARLLLSQDIDRLFPIELAAKLGVADAAVVLYRATCKLLLRFDEAGSRGAASASWHIALRQTLPRLLLIASAFGHATVCDALLRIPSNAAEVAASDDMANASSEKRRDETEYAYQIATPVGASELTPVSAPVSRTDSDDETIPWCNLRLERSFTLGKYDAQCNALHIAAANGHFDVVALLVSGHIAAAIAAEKIDAEGRHAEWLLQRAAHEHVHGVPPRPHSGNGVDGSGTSLNVSPIRGDRPGEQEDEFQMMTSSSPSSPAALTAALTAAGVSDHQLHLWGRNPRARTPDLMSTDRMQRSALHYAAEGRGADVVTGNTPVLRLLCLLCPAAVNAQDRGGHTPLELALRAKQQANAQFLMTFRAPVSGESHRHEPAKVNTREHVAGNVSETLLRSRNLPAKINVSGVEIDISSFTRTPIEDPFLTRFDSRNSGPEKHPHRSFVAAPAPQVVIAAAPDGGLASLPPAVAASRGNDSLWRAHTYSTSGGGK